MKLRDPALHRHDPANNPWSRKTVRAHRTPPKGPERHQTFWIQTDRTLGTTYTIIRVNSRSFYFYNEGTTGRRLLVEWKQWLCELFDIGFVYCDGRPVEAPREPGYAALEFHGRRQAWYRGRRPTTGPCRHILAAMLSEDQFRHRLFDYIL